MARSVPATYQRPLAKANQRSATIFDSWSRLESFNGNNGESGPGSAFNQNSWNASVQPSASDKPKPTASVDSNASEAQAGYIRFNQDSQMAAVQAKCSPPTDSPVVGLKLSGNPDCSIISRVERRIRSAHSPSPTSAKPVEII